MRESAIENKLTKAVKKMGGLPLKLISPSLVGLPDRLLLMPGGKIAFIELKASGQAMRPLQMKRKRQLEDLGFPVYCIDDTKQIGGILDELQAS